MREIDAHRALRTSDVMMRVSVYDALERAARVERARAAVKRRKSLTARLRAFLSASN